MSTIKKFAQEGSPQDLFEDRDAELYGPESFQDFEGELGSRSDFGDFWDLPRGEHSSWNLAQQHKLQTGEITQRESTPDIYVAQAKFEKREPQTNFIPISRRDQARASGGGRSVQRIDPSTVPESERHLFLPRAQRVEQSRSHYLLSQHDHHPEQLCAGRGHMVKFIEEHPAVAGLRSERNQNYYPNIGVVFDASVTQPPVLYHVPDELLQEHHRICGPHAPNRDCARSYKVVGSVPRATEITTFGGTQRCPDCKGDGREMFDLATENGITRVPKPIKPAVPPVFRDQRVLVKGTTPAVYGKCTDCKGSGQQIDSTTKRYSKCTSCNATGVDKDNLLEPAKPPVYKTQRIVVKEGQPPTYKKCSTCNGDGEITTNSISKQQIAGHHELITEPKNGECPFADHMRYCDYYHDPDCSLAPKLQIEHGKPQVTLHILPFKYNPHVSAYLPHQDFGVDRLVKVPAESVEHLDPKNDLWQPHGESPFNYELIENLGRNNVAWHGLLQGLKEDWDRRVTMVVDPSKNPKVTRAWNPLEIPRGRLNKVAPVSSEEEAGVDYDPNNFEFG